MTTSHLGWGLVIGGIAVQALESMAQSDATLNNTTFANTGIGKLAAPIEKFLPVSLGFSMMLVGVACLWVLPAFGD